MFENGNSFDLLLESYSEGSIRSPHFSPDQYPNINDKTSSEKIFFGNLEIHIDPFANYKNEELLNIEYKSTGGSNPTFKSQKRKRRKFCPDNILTKTNTHFLNFLICFINFFLKFYDIKEKFLKIDYKYKKIKNSYLYQLKNETLGDILIKGISPKFRTINNLELLMQMKIKKFMIKL